MIREPGFWHDPPAEPGPWTRLLSPLGAATARVAARRHARIRRTAEPVPVVSVGNLVQGGQGKTPLAVAIAELLAARGLPVHFVTRGYGGRERGPYRVDPERDSHRRVGDEPLLLAAVAPTWVSRDRGRGVAAATKAGARIAVLDDGHQTVSVSKTVSLLAIDADYGFGNGRVFPAGPLRERVTSGLARADAILLTGEGAFRPDSSLPVIRARFRPVATGMAYGGTRVFAFAGIARPSKFFDTLAATGATILRRESFPNHHRYAPLTVLRMIRDASALGALLVTTEKDAVRIPPQYRTSISVLKLRTEFENAGMLDRVLEPAITAATALAS